MNLVLVMSLYVSEQLAMDEPVCLSMRLLDLNHVPGKHGCNSGSCMKENLPSPGK